MDIKITDDTVVPVSKIELDQSEMAFEITRTLEGERRNPKETYTVTPSKRLYEKVTPEYADNKEVSWSAGDSDILRVDKESVVSVREKAKWITDLIQAEKEKQKENPYGEPEHRLNTLLPWIAHIREIGCNALYSGPLCESVGHG